MTMTTEWCVRDKKCSHEHEVNGMLPDEKLIGRETQLLYGGGIWMRH